MLQGKLTISRVESNQEPNFITIELVDDLSGARIVYIKLTPETLGLLLTGKSYLDCEFELGELEYVGKTREAKRERLRIPVRTPKYEDIVEAAKPYEVDGWRLKESPDSRIEPTKRGEDWSLVQALFIRYVETHRRISDA